jgi:hypothetical protein
VVIKNTNHALLCAIERVAFNVGRDHVCKGGPMKSLMEQYTEETHRGAYSLMCHVHAATDGYVEWLEARLMAAESANTASNKPTTPCSRHDLEDHDTYFTCRKCGMHFSDSDVVGD